RSLQGCRKSKQNKGHKHGEISLEGCFRRIQFRHFFFLPVSNTMFFVVAFPRRKAEFPSRDSRVRISGRKTALAREKGGVPKSVSWFVLCRGKE
ncbi:MAG: hypothetical protein IJW40_02775, partial [Clostridia bacterium]|nr:hypothetical protein [Clostridia bacterium]